MKTLVLLLMVWLLPVSVSHAQKRQSANGPVNLNVLRIVHSEWHHLGTVDGESFDYQPSNVIQYGGAPLNPDNVDFDVVVKKSVKGPNNVVTEITLLYGTVICDKSGSLPEQFPVIGMKTLRVDAAGNPDNGVDNTWEVYPPEPTMLTIKQGSVFAVLAKRVCVNVHR